MFPGWTCSCGQYNGHSEYVVFGDRCAKCFEPQPRQSDVVARSDFDKQLDTTRINLELLCNKAEQGEHWTIAKGDKPVAVIIGYDELNEMREKVAAFERGERQ